MNQKKLSVSNRFWHHSSCEKVDGLWQGDMPLYSIDKPIWAYANVTYQLDKSEAATNYYYREFSTDKMVISSVPSKIESEMLHKAIVQTSLQGSLVIEDFTSGWENDWFTYDPSQWAVKTNKLNHPMWTAPKDAKLALQVSSVKPNKHVVRIDGFATEIELTGSGETETFLLRKEQFKNASKAPLENWSEASELELAPYVSISSKFNQDGISKLKWVIEGE